MIRRLAGLAVGIPIGVGLLYVLDGLLDVRYALAAGMGAGTGVFLVVDGSAGAGEGWIYHRVRSPVGIVLDGLASVAGGVVLALVAAGLALALEIGLIGSTVLVVAGGFMGANAVYLYRRPNYEEQLDDME